MFKVLYIALVNQPLFHPSANYSLNQLYIIFYGVIHARVQ